MTAYQRPRAGDPAEVGTPPTFEVKVDGRPVTAQAGQTVAAVLLANGHDTWRTTRIHNRPRGVFCGIGACQDCLVTLNNTPNTRACQRTITPGDTISTQPLPLLPTPTGTTAPDAASTPASPPDQTVTPSDETTGASAHTGGQAGGTPAQASGTPTPGDTIGTRPVSLLPTPNGTTAPGAASTSASPSDQTGASSNETGGASAQAGGQAGGTTAQVGGASGQVGRDSDQVGGASGSLGSVGVGARAADVVVVGAGPAGVAAALAAADGGAEVLVVDSGRAVGGQYNRQLPEEFAARRPDRLQHEWKAFEVQRDRLLEHPRIAYLPETSVWALEGLRLWAQTGPADAPGRQPFAIDAKAVVLATGAYDRVLPFPGWDLPGVYTAGAAQALAKGQRIAVGHRVLVAGTGPFLLPVAESLIGVGAHVVALLEANTLKTVRAGWSTDVLVAPSKLREAAGYGALLARHRVPLRHGWTVLAAHGSDHVEAATIARLDENWHPVRGTERRVAVDAICLGFGFTANLELAVSARCALGTGPDGGPAVTVDANQQTTTPGYFAAGELTGIGGAALSTAEGAVAGTAAARQALSATQPPRRTTPDPTTTQPPVRPTTDPAVARRPVGATVGPAVVQPPARATVDPTVAQRPVGATADSAVVQPPLGAAADPAVAQPSVGATVDPAVAEGAVPATADSAGVRPSVGAAVDPAVAKGRRFAVALAKAYPVRDGWKDWSTAETLVCRCEEVTRGELEAAADDRGLRDGRAMKLSSRAGLGMCQGRVCSRTVAALLAGPGDVPDPSMKRPIAVPVRLRDLAAAEVAESAEMMEEQ
ncbi:2Fe-2S iron-sulfur cluster-binding protein [Kribbella sp. GL6]|uniref:2Fe-2S iron-sulfur cluster-binding protein n=1 Tax=Kribbella sp. GL6 TaxID=3419765 RepID=UPI003CFF6E6D